MPGILIGHKEHEPSTLPLMFRLVVIEYHVNIADANGKPCQTACGGSFLCDRVKHYDHWPDGVYRGAHVWVDCALFAMDVTMSWALILEAPIRTRARPKLP